MTAKLYINTDIDIPITIGTGLVIADIVSLTVNLTKAGATDGGVTFSGDAIDIGVTTITLSIPDSGGITVPGVYNIKILFTDSAGNIRGLTPTPDFLKFYA